MKRNHTLRYAAGVLTATLALGGLTACGNDEANTPDTATSQQATPDDINEDGTTLEGNNRVDEAANLTENQHVDKKKDKDKDKKESKDSAKSDDNKGANTGTNPQTEHKGPDPDGPGVIQGHDLNVKPAKPLEGGKQVAEKSEIPTALTSLVGGLYEQQDLHGFLRYIPENTCKDTVAQSGGFNPSDLNQVPNRKLSEIPEYDATTHLVKVSNVLALDGRASADVTVANKQGETTTTMQFVYEDNRWKFCAPK